jgi:23S rRNA (cytosine1962-C5)-methyltransferase
MRTWTLRKGAEKRFQSGHPWVFSNELESSPKGTSPGEGIVLKSADGKFLAYGYGNPNSLISFRTLSKVEDQVPSVAWWASRLQQAWDLRRKAGVAKYSHRLVFAEGDFLPGLIIDCYKLESPKAQVFVIQSSTAGMDLQLPLLLSGLKQFVETNTGIGYTWDETSIVLSNTSAQRRLEGLQVEERRVEKSVHGVDLNNVSGLFEYAAHPEKSITIQFNLLGGQKTGFFLDQRENIRSLMSLLRTWDIQTPLRVLDLCCYVGQWSTQIAAFAKERGIACEMTFLDASEDALKIASMNLQGKADLINPIKGDVMNGLRGTIDYGYDIVICDPPAFIKKKKDVPQGKAAYLKLNKDALKKLDAGGIFVSCSCSGLLLPEEFRSMLGKISVVRPGLVWLKQGFHSPDHPQRMEFPEGAYLKCLIGVSPSAQKEVIKN